MLVHASDLGGQALPRASRLNWSARILAEFASQAAAERALGLPTAPFMLGLDDGLRAARLQLSFVQSVVLPLWQAVHACNLLPQPQAQAQAQPQAQPQPQGAAALGGAAARARRRAERARAPLPLRNVQDSARYYAREERRLARAARAGAAAADA